MSIDDGFLAGLFRSGTATWHVDFEHLEHKTTSDKLEIVFLMAGAISDPRKGQHCNNNVFSFYSEFF